MNTYRALNIIWNDRRVRTATISFFLPLFTLLLFEGFSSYILSVLYLSAFSALTFYLTDRRYYSYGFQAWLLGSVAGYSIVANMLTSSQTITIFTRYSLIMSLFHFSEMFFIGITNNENLKTDSFLLNHSIEYWLAATVSWFEFGLESLSMPWLNSNYISYFGVILCIGGEIVRKLAMWHASSAFTHLIAYKKNRHHSLVTDGIYAYCRHPGYLGWFLWSVGTQITLCNPFCLIGYIYVTYNFFKDRIYDEERYLIEFFGHRYINYQREVPIGIPFIKGYQQLQALPANPPLD